MCVFVYVMYAGLCECSVSLFDVYAKLYEI